MSHTGTPLDTIGGGPRAPGGRILTQKIAEGNYTSVIYTAIRQGRYQEAIHHLNQALQDLPKSRAALSLLGYCYYIIQDYQAAANCYEQLSRQFPDLHEYQLYLAQSLYKASDHEAALKACSGVDNPEYKDRILKLQAAIHYEMEDLPATQGLIDQCAPDDSDTIGNVGCILYKSGEYEKALQKFTDSMSISGYKPVTDYHIALCNFRLKRYTEAHKHLAEIIERGIREHPELSVGAASEADSGGDVRSVGNSQALLESGLIQAFNLKCAIEFDLKDFDMAKQALKDMPPRLEEELDKVTLHNTALGDMETDPNTGFKKLNFLLQEQPCPAETFANLLIFYCKYGFFDLAADVLAENEEAVFRYMSDKGGQELYNYLDALITTQSSPEEGYRKFEDLARGFIDSLRLSTKEIADAKRQRDVEAVKTAVAEYEDILEKYIPVLMSQAKIYWDRENYAYVETIFKQSEEFCLDHDIWKLNVAHALFMQESNQKFHAALQFYKPSLPEDSMSILQVPAMVLANMCVAFIMTGQNKAAEDLMKQVENEEQGAMYEDPDTNVYHLCIINLVIGTLYCSKGNYEFGVTRVIKSLEPYDKKLSTDTWYYAKRCFMGLAEALAKHIVVLKEPIYNDLLQFFIKADEYGKSIPAEVAAPLPPVEENSVPPPPPKTVSDEARMMRRIFLLLREG